MDSLELQLLRAIEKMTGLRLKSNQVTQSHAALMQLSLQRDEETDQTLAWLESEPLVLERFAAQFTIPETHFHRIQPQMQILRQRILPSLFEARVSRRAWRFWSAGCSSGEEVYTLIILALEFLASQQTLGNQPLGTLGDQPLGTLGSSAWQLEVLGTDLNPAILERARAALYNEWSFRDTPLAWRDQYFIKQQEVWQLIDAVRQHARFELLNLIGDSWQAPAELDLILCRNVTIYFSNRTAQKVYERLASRLSMGGWLVLGPSDPPPTRQTLEAAQLQPIFENGAIIWQRVPQTELSPNLAQVPWVQSKNPSLEITPRLPKNPSLEFQVERLAKREINATIELPPYQPLPDLTAVPVVRSQNTLTLEGMNLLEQNNPNAALLVLRRAAYLEPNDAVTQFALARTCLMLGDKKRAMTALRQSRRLIAALPDDALLSLETTVKDLHRALTALANQLR